MLSDIYLNVDGSIFYVLCTIYTDPKKDFIKRYINIEYYLFRQQPLLIHLKLFSIKVIKANQLDKFCLLESYIL